MLSFYEDNKDFRDYVDAYCKKHKISVESALQHYIVRAVADQIKKSLS
jgi:hypothetical protein